MKLPELSVKYAPFTVVVSIALLVMGLSAFFALPRKEDPIILVPGAVVYVVYPGAQPADIEQLVVEPIEEAINELEDLDFIRSISQNGLAVISVEFEYGLDADEKYNEVVEKVSGIRAALPNAIVDIRFRKRSNINTVMMQVALVSESASGAELEQYGEGLQKRLQRINGIKTVDLRATQAQQVQVYPDLDRLVQLGIPLNQLGRAIEGSNLNIPGGSVRMGQRAISLETSGPYRDLDQIRQTVVSSYQGQAVQLGDVAEVSLGYEDTRYLARYNGEAAVYFTVVQKEKANIFSVSEDIQAAIELYRQQLPSHIRLETAFQQADIVQERINGFLGNLLQGIFLVGLVIFMALGVRASLIVIVAIPFSILIGLAGVYQLGFGLQQMTISALVVALGLLVDNSIAIVENIERFLQMGYSRKDAAIEGTKQLAWPISSATLTTLLAFFPLVMMPEVAGDFLKSMPITVMLTLTASLLLALSLTPLISRHFLRKERSYVPPLERMGHYLVKGPYKRLLNWVLEHPWWTLVITMIIFAGSLAMIPLVGASFFPKAERPQFLIRVEAERASHISHTDELVKQVESVLAQQGEVKSYVANVGKGNARVYYNVFENSYESNYGDLLVQLHRYEAQEFNALIARLEKELAQVAGAKISIVVFEQGIVAATPIEVRLTGDDLKKLQTLAGEIKQLIQDVPGLIDLENPLEASTPLFRLNINREKAGLLGVSLPEIDQTVRTCISGRVVSQYRDANGKAYDILLRLPNGGDFGPEAFAQIYVPTVTGQFVPLNQIATLELSKSAVEITHYDLERYTSLTADFDEAYNLNEVVNEVERRLEAYAFAPGYNFRMAGERELRNETFGGMGEAAIIAALLILGVLVLQFQSFLQPLIIFSAIPLAAIGSIWALFFMGLNFSLTAVVGLISLIGIVINDSIVFVDFANQERKAGKTIKEALMSAGSVRFMPIILTSLTTIGGLIPLTILGGTLWAPMSTAMIGGLITSTVLILCVVPVLYWIFTREND
ncbi:MAG: efflux RND transporter permease subunit [Bacteroidia bacterium]